jgi:hypothetical protein
MKIAAKVAILSFSRLFLLAGVRIVGALSFATFQLASMHCGKNSVPPVLNGKGN